MRSQYDNLGTNYTKELEAKVANGMDAAKLAIKQLLKTKMLMHKLKHKELLRKCQWKKLG